MLLLFAYLFLALFVSFLCSILESVLLSTPQSFLHVKTEEGKNWAETFSEFKNNIDRPLSAILSLNTIAHTIGAAGVGAQAVKVFGEEYFGVVSAILTILILLVTEIIPKTLGARYWRSFTKFTAITLKILIFLIYPLVRLTELITNLFSKNNHENTTSREEISALASIGQNEGVLSENENMVIQNIIKLKSIKASEIMTPRVVVTYANENDTLKQFLSSKKYSGFTRIPIMCENDNICGFILRPYVYELSKEDNNNNEKKLSEFKRSIPIVPVSISIFKLWEKLVADKEHISAIVNEYGGFMGLVTLEDIIETLFGIEIVDETDRVTDMQKYAKERWKLRKLKYNMLDEIKKNEID
jgi:CBS domain containing-hemolysin-like protein